MISESLPWIHPLRGFRELQWLKNQKALKEIQLLVFDVDGVLTDGGLWFDGNGEVQKRFDVRDGLGIRLLQSEGLVLAFLSGGKGGATELRARQLGVEYCLVGVKNKPQMMQRLQKDLSISSSKTAFLGDDLNDLSVRPYVKLLLSTSNGSFPLRKAADAVLAHRGGYGAVRELAERILKSRNQWEKFGRSGWIDNND